MLGVLGAILIAISAMFFKPKEDEMKNGILRAVSRLQPLILKRIISRSLWVFETAIRVHHLNFEQSIKLGISSIRQFANCERYAHISLRRKKC